jgi:hypothetical protein
VEQEKKEPVPSLTHTKTTEEQQPVKTNTQSTLLADEKESIYTVSTVRTTTSI